MSISPFAIIEAGAVLGANCSVGHFSIIKSGARLGNGVSIGSHCVIGVESELAKTDSLEIGDSAVIRSHSVIYIGSRIGENFVTGHHVTIRENVTFGASVQVGTLSDIQGDCEIGEFSRLHSNVHVGKLSKIGCFVWLYPYVVLTNDPTPPSANLHGVTLEDFAVVATMSTVLPGITIGFGSLIGAHSLVQKNIPAEVVAVGSPTRVIKNVSQLGTLDDGVTPLYPWHNHFTRGYPDNLAERYLQSRQRFVS
jgi:acetyltransferase-like isoleucine patch superfamily enzyme